MYIAYVICEMVVEIVIEHGVENNFCSAEIARFVKPDRCTVLYVASDSIDWKRHTRSRVMVWSNSHSLELPELF